MLKLQSELRYKNRMVFNWISTVIYQTQLEKMTIDYLGTFLTFHITHSKRE